MDIPGTEWWEIGEEFIANDMWFNFIDFFWCFCIIICDSNYDCIISYCSKWVRWHAIKSIETVHCYPCTSLITRTNNTNAI